MKKIACFAKIIFVSLSILTFISLSDCAKPSSKEISIIGTWGGSELDKFMAVAKAADVIVNFETTGDLNALIKTRIKSNNAPDIAILPNPAKLRELASQNKLVALSFLDPQTLLADYSRSWLDLASYEGNLYGTFFGASNKSLIWYNPEEFEKSNLNVPKTWSDLLLLTQRISMNGKIPWSIGRDRRSLSYWFENIMVRAVGPIVYENWIEHKLPWTSPEIKNAFFEWGKIVGNPAYFLEDASSETAACAVFQDPPKAYMYCGDDSVGRIVRKKLPGIVLGENMAFFQFPEIDPKYGNPVVGSADVFVAFKDTPSVRKLITFLTTREAHEIRVEKGGFLSQNRNMASNLYSDHISRFSAFMLVNADVFVYDASDLMPQAVGKKGLYEAYKKFIQNPANIDNILDDMETIASNNY